MNDDMPLVSVVMPIYNVEKYLPECLDSVINQTYKNLEIILVDDGSPDNCGKICDEYSKKDSRIKVIHKANGGVSSARNAGIDLSTGEWIWFCDPDDWVEKNLISDALNTALNDETDMCFFDYEIFNEACSQKVYAIHSDNVVFYQIKNIDTFITYFSAMGSICYFIVKSQVIKEKLYFDEKINFCEDELFKFMIYDKISSFSYLHKTLYHYRQSENSAVGSILKKKNYPEMMIDIYRKMVEVISHGNYPENAVTVANARYLSRIGYVLAIAFQDRFSLKCDYEMIKKYMSTDEYKQARLNYDKGIVHGHSNTLCASLKKPNRFFITMIYLLSKIWRIVKK